MNNSRIMIVEDQTIVAEDLKDRLISMNYQVPAMVTSGEEAIDKAAKIKPDLVLMDIILNGQMDGVEAAETILETQNIPVVYLTAHSDSGTFSRARDSAPFGYVIKPFRELELGTVIEIALARKEKEARKEKKHIQEKFQQTQKMESLGVLAGGIAHEFNNILTGITGNVMLAQLESPSGSEIKEYLLNIEKAAFRAGDISRQMLVYSGKGQLNLIPMNITAMVSDITKLLRLSVANNIGTQFNLTKNLPLTTGDPEQLQQVLMNLIVNASEAIDCPEKGMVTISTGTIEMSHDMISEASPSSTMKPGKYVYLEVKDNGCGIGEDIRPKIFDPFFTTKFPGRGLGLAIVLRIVQRHSGGLVVDSELDHGTSFKLLLPCSEELTQQFKISASSPLDWHGSGSVLVIDDDEEVRNVIAGMLRSYGFDVLVASDGREGLSKFEASLNQIDCVTLDLTMPGMDGEETYQELKRLQANVRVLMVSGYTEVSVRNCFSGTEPAGFLQKPFASRELKNKMWELLEKQ